MEISESKPVWLVVGNTDNTEGRGYPVVLYVCESPETANRLGKKRYVQGSDCPIEESVAVRLGGRNSRWLVPGEIQPSSLADTELMVRRQQKEQLLIKLRESGFSDEEIATLSK